jgi:hypothetical protein
MQIKYQGSSKMSNTFLARVLFFTTLKMEATRSTETSVLTRYTRRNITEDGILQISHSLNTGPTLKSNINFFIIFSAFLSIHASHS